MLLLILYIIKEMYFIKFDILSYINTLKNNSEDSNIILRKNFQNDLNVFANKVKLLNDENLQQFRKITLLNTQPIVKNNNYFKELTCSESEDNKSELKYLSDSKLISNNLQTKENNDMTSDYSLTSPLQKKEIKPELKIEEIVIKFNENEKNQETNKMEIEQDEDLHDFVENITLDTDTETSTELSKDDDDDEDEEDDDDVDDEDEDEDDDDDDDEDDDEEDEEDEEDNIEEDVANDNEHHVEEISFEKEELNNVPKSTKDKLLENVMDTITLGTKKSKNNKDEKKVNQDLKEIGMVKDLLETINKENFKTIDDYTMEYLKNIARKFNIPLSIKAGGKWKPLTKPEIYNEISKFLNKNI